MSALPRVLDPRSVPLTTHHLMKVIAIVAMTVDHMGAYLYPDDLWLRAIGRVACPIFLFLVGHALTYRPKQATLIWALVLMVLSPSLGVAVFPLNILVTILICQWLLAQVERYDCFEHHPWALVVGSVVGLISSYLFVEYGALGFLYALMGYAVRSGKIHTGWGYVVAALALGMFLMVMLSAFAFTLPQMLGVIVGTTGVTMLLANFTHRPVSLGWMPLWLKRVGHFLARYSLQYYVVHRVILQAMGTATGVLNPVFRWF